MALDTNSFPASQVTLDIIDYTTPTPLEVDFDDVLTGDVTIPQIRPVESNSLFVNGTTGKAHAGEPVNGQAEPPTFSFTFWEIDTSDASEVSSPLGVIRALANDTVSGTAFSSHVFTSQLNLGGKLQAKFQFTVTNEGGVSHTITVPAVVVDYTSTPSGGARMITANCKVVGAITLA